MEQPFTWTPETERRLAELWHQEPQLSANAIGKIMGLSKNAVVGKAHRLKLPGRESPIRRGHAPKPRERRERAVKVPAPKVAKARPLPAVLPPKEGDPRAIPPRRLASLPELARPSPFKTCQWLSGDGPFTDADKCGKGTVQGRSYCAEHCARAYQQPETGRKAA